MTKEKTVYAGDGIDGVGRSGEYQRTMESICVVVVCTVLSSRNGDGASKCEIILLEVVIKHLYQRFIGPAWYRANNGAMSNAEDTGEKGARLNGTLV